jgi:hypothetical protein
MVIFFSTWSMVFSSVRMRGVSVLIFRTLKGETGGACSLPLHTIRWIHMQRSREGRIFIAQFKYHIESEGIVRPCMCVSPPKALHSLLYPSRDTNFRKCKTRFANFAPPVKQISYSRDDGCRVWSRTKLGPSLRVILAKFFSPRFVVIIINLFV